MTDNKAAVPEQNNINNIIEIEYLKKQTSFFTITKNGFLQLKTTVKNPEKENAVEEIFFDRVLLHRAFPFQNPNRYISVLGQFPKKKEEGKKENPEEEKKSDEIKSEEITPEEKTDENKPGKKEFNDITSIGDFKEIGIIVDLQEFGDEVKNYIISSLDKKYFMPIIKKIYSIKEKYGYSYWSIETDAGKINFTVHDTFRSIIKVTNDRIILNDINGNRYEIPSLEKFDFNSMKKIELFL